jgi:hypothetical protein
LKADASIKSRPSNLKIEDRGGSALDKPPRS